MYDSEDEPPQDYDTEYPEIDCSYCGASVYGDAVRCNKCGNYTDGLGKRNNPDGGSDGRRPIPRIFLIAGWLALIGLTLPLLLSVIAWLTRVK